jgi:hypothetical protein
MIVAKQRTSSSVSPSTALGSRGKNLTSNNENDQARYVSEGIEWPFTLEHYGSDVFDRLARPECRHDPRLIRFNPMNGSLSVASSEMIVIYLTSHDILDYDLLSDFFLTFRLFMTSHLLLELLIGRMTWALIHQASPENDNAQSEIGRDVSVRTFVMLRHWILNFFPDDFVPSYALRVSFANYINALHSWDLTKSNQGFMHILSQLKKAWMSSCGLYWDVEQGSDTDFNNSTTSSLPPNPASPSSSTSHVVPVNPGGHVGSNSITFQRLDNRYASLLSFYQLPIKPVLSNSEIAGDHPIDQNHLVSMMGRLIKGGISLSTDVEIREIQPPTPVQQMSPAIPLSLDPGHKVPRRNQQNSIKTMVDSWKRELGLHKDKAISRFFSKIVNISESKKLDESKAVASATMGVTGSSMGIREIEHGKVRIDILSARVIEELDNILKLQEISALSTPISTSSSHHHRVSSGSATTSVELVNFQNLTLDSETNDTSFMLSEQQPLRKVSQDFKKNVDHFFKHRSLSKVFSGTEQVDSSPKAAKRVSLIDNMNMRIRIIGSPEKIKHKNQHSNDTDDSSSSVVMNFNDPLLRPSSASSISSLSSSINQQWESQSEVSARSPQASITNIPSMLSMRSYDSYDSQFSATRDAINSPTNDQETSPGLGLRRMKNLQNLRTELEVPSVNRGSDLSSMFSNEGGAIRVSVTVPHISVIKPRLMRQQQIFRPAHRHSSLQTFGTRSEIDYSDVDKNLERLAKIPDDETPDDAIEVALRKLEGTYVKPEKSTLATPGLRTLISSGQANVSPASARRSVSSPHIFDRYKQRTGSNDTSLYNGAFETPTKKAIAVTSADDNSNDDKHAGQMKRKNRPTLSIRVVTPSNNERASNPQPEPITAKGIQRLPQDPLSVASSVPHGNHTPFILNFTSEQLTEQFTLIERDALAEIDWKELIELKWSQKLNPIQSWLGYLVERNASGVEVVITRFNLMVNWVKSEILLTRLLKERVLAISRFIHIAHHARRLQNYSTMMQIVLALSSALIKQLRRTWEKVPQADADLLENLEKVVSPFRNFQQLRVEFNSLDTSIGCIPFLGIYLSDLTFNAERPAFVSSEQGPKGSNKPGNNNNGGFSSSKTTSPSTPGFDHLDESNNDEETIVNFDRFRMSASVVKSLIQCIEWSSNYNFKADQDLLAKCLYIQSLTDEEMNLCHQYLDEEER